MFVLENVENNVHFWGLYSKIPEHMQAALVRYVNEHIRPGDFLTAVICNDLRDAVGRADDININLLRVYVQWFYNVAPGYCWGSAQKMENWLARRSR